MCAPPLRRRPLQTAAPEETKLCWHLPIRRPGLVLKGVEWDKDVFNTLPTWTAKGMARLPNPLVERAKIQKWSEELLPSSKNSKWMRHWQRRGGSWRLLVCFWGVRCSSWNKEHIGHVWMREGWQLAVWLGEKNVTSHAWEKKSETMLTSSSPSSGPEIVGGLSLSDER